jgi:hypothetical protein
MTVHPVVSFDEAARLELVRRVHEAPGMIVLAVTGGGIAAVTDLLLVPGASRTVLEVTVPYAASALAELGGGEDGAVSLATARRMAQASLARARCLRPDPATPVAGVGCTAALVTDRERRGADRACLAVALADDLLTWEITLEKAAMTGGSAGRAAQDRIVADHVLRAVARAVGAA